MKAGDVIEFGSDDRHVFGVITRDLGQKFIVVTEDGEEMRPSPDEVSLKLGRKIDSSSSSEVIARQLGRLRDHVETACDEVDPEFLWEFIGEQGEVGADELARLFFDSADLEQMLGLSEALRRDEVYFKEVDSGDPESPPRFETRSEEHVEQLLEQRRARRREEERREKFVDDIREILNAPADERADMVEERMAETEFRHLIQLLQGYAIHDRDYGERDDALDLLNALSDEIDVELEGKYGERAFSLMVELGIWGEHENLWIHRYDLDASLGEEAAQQVEQLNARDWTPEPWREDLSGATAFSIDDPSTMDIDDALSCQPRGSDGTGGWEVGIHVADPSSLIDKDSPLDQYARNRGTSIYLPDGNISMLPEEISHDEASLVAGQKRPAISVLAEFSADAELEDWRVVPSVVEVDERLTYDDADALISDDDTTDETLPDGLENTITALRGLAVEQRRRREEMGAIEIDLPDPELSITWEDGEPKVDCRVKEGSTPARDLVGECMILTNHLLGKYCRDHDIPVIYRGQPPPDGDLNDDDIMSTPEGRARTFQRLYRLQPGRMTTEPTEHSGLGLSVYTQATSPIRRYADLVCQRQIKSHLADEELPYDEDEMLEVLADIEESDRQASRAQSEGQRYWILMYLKQRADHTEEPLVGEVIDHYNDDGTRGAVFVEEVAQKFGAQFREAVPVGETTELEIEHVDPRRDELTLTGGQ